MIFFTFILLAAFCNVGGEPTILAVFPEVITTPVNTIVKHNCTMSHKPLGCSTEFLFNNSTSGNARFYNGECHGSSIRHHHEFFCNSDCRTFQLSYTEVTLKKGDTCGCQIRFKNESNGFMYKAHAFTSFNGKDFNPQQLVIIPINTMGNAIKTDGGDREANSISTGILMAILMSTLLFVSVLGIMILRRTQNVSCKNIRSLNRNTQHIHETQQLHQQDKKKDIESQNSLETSL